MPGTFGFCSAALPLVFAAAAPDVEPLEMVSFLKRWLILAVAAALAAAVVPGIHYSTSGLIVVTLLLSVLNAFVRPALMLLSLPLLIFSLGLFMLVINALLLWGVGNLVRGFRVDSFGAAFWGSLLISIVSLVLNSLTGSGDSRLQVRRGRPHGPRPPPDGNGPVIDV